MTIRSGLFMSINGDRRYKTDFFAEYFATFIGNGVFPNPSDNLQVVANNDMTITVSPGSAWINGYVAFNDNDFLLELIPADGVLSRVDRVVLRWDLVDREIKLLLKQGEMGENPNAQNLQRNADAYELALADIRVNKGTTTITQANITDLRLSKELCGIVHGVVDQVDTEVLFQDYQSWINSKKNEFDTDIVDYKTLKQEEIDQIQSDFQEDFMIWFDSIQGILDENVAGNLLGMIETIRNDIENISMILPTGIESFGSVSQWSDILIPNEKRGKGLLQFLLGKEETSLEISSNEQAMLVIMEEERFDKNRQVPFDYEQIIYKLGHETEVGQYLAWVEELIANHTRGVEKLELGLMLESGSLEITNNKHAMDVIMNGESAEGLTNYRNNLIEEQVFNATIKDVNNNIERLDGRIDEVVV